MLILPITSIPNLLSIAMCQGSTKKGVQSYRTIQATNVSFIEPSGVPILDTFSLEVLFAELQNDGEPLPVEGAREMNPGKAHEKWQSQVQGGLTYDL